MSIDATSAASMLAAYRQSDMTVAMMKKSIEAQQAVAQMVAQAAEQGKALAAQQGSKPSGSFIDIYA